MSKKTITANQIIRQNQSKQLQRYLAMEVAKFRVALAVLAKEAGGEIKVDLSKYKDMQPPVITVEGDVLTVLAVEVKPSDVL